ncbi:MAG: phosphotransferase [Planctomycetes bacterium]|nr:phosphotransferase [Planctomycetota bacterium]
MADPVARKRWQLAAADGAAASLASWDPGAEWPWPAAAAREVARNDGRAVVRLELPGAPPLFVKRFDPPQRRVFRREEAAARACAERGIAAPRIVARGRRRDGAALLAFAELRGEPFDVALAAADGARRATLLAALPRALAQLHAAGIAHGALFAWHAWVVDDSFAWIDLAQARVRSVRRTCPDVARAADWAALFATLDRRRLSLAERARMLAAYEPDRTARRRLAGAIRRARGKLFEKARLPRPEAIREWTDDAQRLVVADEVVRSWDLAAPIGAVESWLAPERAVVVRTRDGRANLRWSDPPGEPGATWFGKRFDAAPRHGRSPAFQEWVNARALASLGIAVPDVVAVARRHGGASICWTRGVAPGATLRELLPALAPREPRRLALLDGAARLARRLHSAGFLHRDLYLDHFLPRADGSLVVIDPTRVSWHARLPGRGRTKDLAALEFSARAAGVTRAERWRGLLAYARGDRAFARRLARRALSKAARIAAHERRHGRPGPEA